MLELFGQPCANTIWHFLNHSQTDDGKLGAHVLNTIKAKNLTVRIQTPSREGGLMFDYSTGWYSGTIRIDKMFGITGYFVEDTKTNGRLHVSGLDIPDAVQKLIFSADEIPKEWWVSHSPKSHWQIDDMGVQWKVGGYKYGHKLFYGTIKDDDDPGWKEHSEPYGKAPEPDMALPPLPRGTKPI